MEVPPLIGPYYEVNINYTYTYDATTDKGELLREVVIEDLVGPKTITHPYPEALNHLITTTKKLDYSDVEKEKLIQSFSDPPPPQVIKFIRACGKELKDITDENNKQILKAVPYNKDKKWKDDFVGKETFSYIEECFKHKDTN
ncbi:hypothetical protein OROMI_003118 [Orobanche minor]